MPVNLRWIADLVGQAVDSRVGGNPMHFTAREEIAIALASAFFVFAYALSDIPVWLGFI